mgnify:FL=1
MKITITKEQLATLDRVSFNGNIHIVDTLPKLDMAITKLKEHNTLGFDTETRPSFKKGISHSVALMQISTLTDCYLIRINKIGMPSTLRMFLEDGTITKVGLSLKDDFGVIHKGYDAEMSGFVDLQKIVPTFNIADASLQKIYAILFDKRISKGQRLSNWEADTLSGAQQEYAAIDAWACLKIYQYLNSGNFIPTESKYVVNENED